VPKVVGCDAGAPGTVILPFANTASLALTRRETAFKLTVAGEMGTTARVYAPDLVVVAKATT
jgi:hypothetical protein